MESIDIAASTNSGLGAMWGWGGQEGAESCHESGKTLYKGQLISEWIFDVLNFPKTNGKVWYFCPRI